MELTKSQTKRINKFVEIHTAKSSHTVRGSDYSCEFNIRDNQLWYYNRMYMCDLNDELLLKFSYKDGIIKYFGELELKQTRKAFDCLWEAKIEQDKFEIAEKLAVIIEQKTEHNERVKLIKRYWRTNGR